MNGIITKVRPSIMLPAIMFLWGAIVCFMALVSDFRGLYGLRILLGVFESVNKKSFILEKKLKKIT